jgi:hypothetical protein
VGDKSFHLRHNGFMTLRKTVSLAAILIFGIAIAVTFSLRTACDVNELAYETACENNSFIDAMMPAFFTQDKINCDTNDTNTAFKSAVSYFLEKHENSPPC